MGTGIPNPFKEEYIERARALAQEGRTRKGIAIGLGVSRSTLYKWQCEHPELKEAMDEGADVANATKAEEGLWKLSHGYYSTETRVETVEITGKMTDFDKKMVTLKVPGRKITRTTKWHPPNVVAVIFSLVNREPERWKDLKQVEILKGGTKELEDRLQKAHERARDKAKKEGKVVEIQ